MYEFFVAHGFILELLLSFTVFALALKRRKLFLLRLCACIGGLFAYSFLRNLVPNVNAWTESVKYIVLYAVCLGFVLFLFEVSVWEALFCTIGASLTQHCAFKAGDVARHFLTETPVALQSFVYILTVVAVNAAVFALFARRLMKEKDSEYLQSIPVLLMSGAMLIVCAFWQQLFEQYGEGIGAPLYVIFAGFDITCCVFALCIQYAVFRSAGMHREYSLMEHLLHMQKEQMQITKETIDLINVKCHDLKKMISVLGDKNHLSKEEIGELNRAISIYDASVKTGNESLDVLLAEKTLFCENKNIQINCIADGFSLGFMNPSDIYSLFGNAIDNAVEAVEKIEDCSKRCIGIVIKESKKMITAHFENYYTGELNFDEGLPVTTKTDKRYHGYGMKSIKMLVEKYGGWISMKAEGDVFKLDLLLPVPETSARGKRVNLG